MADIKLYVVNRMVALTAANGAPQPRLKFFNHDLRPMLIAHWTGYSLLYHYPAFAAFRHAPISVPDNVTIVTFATDNILPQAVLVHQLEAAGIPYCNPAAGMTDWQNTRKHPLLVALLPEIATEYTLVLDSLDVLLCRPLDPLVARFKTYDKKIMFGATSQRHPPMDIDYVPNRSSLGKWQHLNAGTVFGRTEDLLPFYRRAIELFEARDPTDQSWRSEQRVIRAVFAERMDTVGFDHRSLLFQNFGGGVVWQQDHMVTIT